MDFTSWKIDPVWMYYPSAALLVLLCVGAWSMTLLTLPGNWFVVLLATGFAWLFPEQEERGITWWTVGVLAGLAAVGEVIEFIAGAAGAAQKGASRRAVVLSLVGAMLGSIGGLVVGLPILVVGPLVAAVLGGAAGAFAGAYVGEYWKGKPEDERIAVGQGAFVGRIWGAVGKLAVGAIMLAIVAWDAFV